MKLVYAGLLGVAQDVLGIVKNIDFRQLGVTFHIYGAGNQLEPIKDYLARHDTGVEYRGSVSKAEINTLLDDYDTALVPLVTHIKGAVPSKIFDVIPHGIPILFSGEGEGADIIEEYGIGFVSRPKDYGALRDNIVQYCRMTPEEREAMAQRCVEVSDTYFDFDRQMDECYAFLNELIR